MSLSENMRSAIVIGAAIAFTPLLVSGLSRLAPPRSASSRDIEALKRKYRATEAWSQAFFFVGMFSGLAFALSFGRNTPWIVGILFGWSILAPVFFIAVVTLPRGRPYWDGFWLFYELKYKIGLRFIFPLYGLFGILGLISTAALIIRS